MSSLFVDFLNFSLQFYQFYFLPRILKFVISINIYNYYVPLDLMTTISLWLPTSLVIFFTMTYLISIQSFKFSLISSSLVCLTLCFLLNCFCFYNWSVYLEVMCSWTLCSVVLNPVSQLLTLIRGLTHIWCDYWCDHHDVCFLTYYNCSFCFVPSLSGVSGFFMLLLFLMIPGFSPCWL